MKVLAFISSKGGSGKSSLAASLAAAAAGAGQIVVAVDTDPQRSLSAWGRRRAAKDMVHQFAEPADLKRLIREMRASGRVDLVIIDTAGVAGNGSMLAAHEADLVLVPIRPTLTDLDAARTTITSLKEVRARFAIVFTQVPPGALERAREAARAIVAHGRTAPAYTRSVVAYADAMADGTGVTEFASGRAGEEIAALWDWIKQELSDGA